METTTGPHGIELVWCPPGTFRMGEGDEAYRVTLTKGFWLGKYPVTQREWTTIMGSNPSHFKNVGDRAPVENVSWHDAQEFLKKLGDAFRFPTEAEWEYACRAGSSTAYCFGDDKAQLGDYAWYNENSDRTTHPVGQRKPNPWGIHDVHGNVWEWCQDGYGDYPAGSVTDPTEPPQAVLRVFRGGGWCGNARFCRSAFRSKSVPTYRRDDLGFRPVC
jgi:formylglycine-generating enzyme required for sulfatase activity